MEITSRPRLAQSPKVYSQEAIHSSRKFFGFAIRNDPKKIMHNACFPGEEKLHDQIAISLAFEAEQRGIEAHADLLAFGIRDVIRILNGPIHSYSPEDARTVSRHPKTIEAIAAIALRDGDSISSYIGVMTKLERPDAEHFDVAAIRTDPFHGCPLAGVGGAINVDPLFARFVPWAAELAISGVEHKRKNATEVTSSRR